MTWFLIAALIVAVVLLTAFYIYQTAFYSPKGKRADPFAPTDGEAYEAYRENILKATKIMDQYTYEPVWITSYDSKKLFARYYHMDDDAPLEIICHGYRSSALRDSSGGHALSRRLKLNTLVIDQRAHGKSDGVTITFGVKERYDCFSWIQYANERFGRSKPIILSGLSMGAATVLMTADLPLPSNVQCIIADSPYSSPYRIIEKVCVDLHYPRRLVKPFLLLSARLYGNFNLQESSAVAAVKQTKLPILLIHGEADDFVPAHMSQQIYASNPERIQLHLFPGAGHGLACMTDPLRYRKIVWQFLKNIPALQYHMDKIDEESLL